MIPSRPAPGNVTRAAAQAGYTSVLFVGAMMRWIAGLILIMLFGLGARAQVNPLNPPTTPPEQEEKRRYKELRYDEDWTFLRASLKQLAWWDPYKYMPLDELGSSYLTLGGEVRQRWERFDNPLRPDAADRDGYLLQRYLLLADLHVGVGEPVSARVFGQVQASLADAQDGAARSTDVDRVDLHQLFADVRLSLDGTRGGDSLTWRVGRQEMLYGSERVVSTRDWANVRQSFDAARLVARLGDWKTDVFMARPVETDPGFFNDGGQNHATFWGLYATLPVMDRAGIDLYYLGLDRPGAGYARGIADEQRHSAGARFFGTQDSWDWDAQGTFQWGTFGDSRLLAWGGAASLGYTWECAMGEPRVAFHAEAGSGDSGGGRLGTYNPLFPKAGYFGPAALFGPQNVTDLGPDFKMRIAKRVWLSAGWDWFWRTSAGDGLYDESGAPLRQGGGDARFIGQQARVGLLWEVPRHITLSIDYVHLFADEFVKQVPPGPGGRRGFCGCVDSISILSRGPGLEPPGAIQLLAEV